MRQKLYAIWTPRTPTHFIEIIKLLSGEQPNPYVKNYKALLELIKPKNFCVRGEKLIEVIVEYEKTILHIFSNGVIIAESEDKEEALKYLNKVLYVFSEIFKAGMPVPALVARDISPIEVEISDNKSEGNFTIYESNEVCISESKIWINKEYFDQKGFYLLIPLVMITCLIKFSRNVINVHRKVWEVVDSIRKPANVSMQTIVKLKDDLMKYKHQLEYIEVRLSQMFEIVKATKNNLEEIYQDPVVKTLYNECIYTLEYIKHLWKKTVEYTKETIDNIETLRWTLHQKELETVRNIAMIYVIVEVGGFLVHHPMSPKEFILFILGALVIAYLIHKVIKHLSRFFWRFKKERFSLGRMREALEKSFEEEDATLEMFHLG